LTSVALNSGRASSSGTDIFQQMMIRLKNAYMMMD
jgi:hypothetical protein